MILYGWNNYLLKTVQFEELGIPANTQPNLQIEYRQKYFHLFFIPFFPLGKFWAIKQNGKLYQPSPELHKSLSSMDVNTKHGLWAWTGFFLIIGGYLLYNASEKINNIQYEKRAAANQSILTTYFKNEKSTTPLASKLHTINFLMDSSVNEDGYERKKIDTSLKNLLNLYLSIQGTQADSLTGYTDKNTLVFTYLNHKRDNNAVVSNEIKKALEDGTWQNRYEDTSSVFSSLRRLNNYKYLLVLKEYNRAAPLLHDGGFSSGISLVNASIINIETEKVEKKFKVIATNSDSIRHFSYGAKNDYDNTSLMVWESLLNNDLNDNATRKASEYVFGIKEQSKTRRYY